MQINIYTPEAVLTLRRTLTSFSQRIKALSLLKLALVLTVAVVCLFGAVNGVLAWHFNDRFYPGAQAGAVELGNVTYGRAQQVLTDRMDRHPLILAFDEDVVKIPTADLDVNYDVSQTINDLKQQPRPWLPIMAWLGFDTSHLVDLAYSADESRIRAKADQLIDRFNREPKSATLTIADGQATLQPEEVGYTYDRRMVIRDMVTGLSHLPDEPQMITVMATPAEMSTKELQPLYEQARQMLAANITLVAEGEEFSPSRAEVGSWLRVTDKPELVFNRDLIGLYVDDIANQVNKAVVNTIMVTRNGQEVVEREGVAGRQLQEAEAIEKIIDALKEAEHTTATLAVSTVEPTVVRPFTYAYCVQANQVDTGKLSYFSQKIAQTLADPRGWSLNGQIYFQKVSSGCSFNLILAAAHTLPHYSSGCSAMWSCRVGPNVIINNDRWEGATTAWNNAGGSLSEYQHMVINHEVGHWLGNNKIFDNLVRLEKYPAYPPLG